MLQTISKKMLKKMIVALALISALPLGSVAKPRFPIAIVSMSCKFVDPLHKNLVLKIKLLASDMSGTPTSAKVLLLNEVEGDMLATWETTNFSDDEPLKVQAPNMEIVAYADDQDAKSSFNMGGVPMKMQCGL